MEVVVQNECSKEKIESVYLPILEAAVSEYRKTIPEDTLVNIRLLGSVPRGDARRYHSDIDFVAICTRELAGQEAEAVTESSAVLSHRYSFIRTVDMEIETAGKITPGREFLFATDSLSIFGTDLYPENSKTIGAIELARNNTPDIGFLVERYREGVLHAARETELLQYSRWIGKDILKSMRGRLIIEHGIYEKEAGKIAAQLGTHYPEDAAVFFELKELYIHPVPDAARMITVLDEVAGVQDRYRIHEPNA